MKIIVVGDGKVGFAIAKQLNQKVMILQWLKIKRMFYQVP